MVAQLVTLFAITTFLGHGQDFPHETRRPVTSRVNKIEMCLRGTGGHFQEQMIRSLNQGQNEFRWL